MKFLLSAIFLILSSFSASLTQAQELKNLKALPVQDAGRLKPLDTFAKESLQLVYGKEKYKSKNGDWRPAIEIVMTWFLQPDVWEVSPLFEIRYGELKKGLKLPDDQKYFSFKEIMMSDRLPTLMQELRSKLEAKEKLDPYFQAVQRLESQLFTFREIASSRMLRVVPPASGDTWISVDELDPEMQSRFSEVVKAFVQVLGAVNSDSGKGKLKEADAGLDEVVQKFQEAAKARNPALYPSERLMRAEVHYHAFHPFQWAWITYLIGAVFCFLAWILAKDSLYKPAWAFAIIGLLLHTYGFALRVYITERAPVSNMYETVIWVGYGSVLFAMIIEAIYRWRFILLAGSIVGAFCLALADMAPLVLDPTLNPIEPVLRNNFWLLVHVLTITISYAAFFLAFALGDIGLVLYFKGENKYKDRLKALNLAIYRSIQIGVALLAPGIILGGIWADYSWGRFWGWDPKETWALIALLGYLAVLHGRLSGWIKDFGMCVSAIVTFSLVIMAWYGVNFVLGAGLHSYGFGAGGVEYVSAFVAVHLLAVIFVSVVRFDRLKKA